MVSAIANGAVRLRSYSYSVPDDMELETAWWHRSCRGTEGLEHSLIRYCAVRWVQFVGDPDPSIEHNWVGRITADLVSKPLGMIAEVGNTDPGYALLAIAKGWSRYAVFPFHAWSGPRFWTLAKGPAYDEWAPWWESRKGEFQ